MKYQVGDRVTGEINNITDLGIFVTLPGHRSGLIHHSDFGNDWLRQRNMHRVHEKVRVVVVHTYKGRLGLSLMWVNDPELVDQHNRFSKVKLDKFEAVLTDVVKESQTEIKKLQETLHEN
ncbi:MULTISPECIES: S1 RNA-binding domain-containing protein [Lactobacillus]|uniref:S1 RNA-binding domain-containing protein n=1 Tax=Lactobacillus xujianguonis TaxID=2495899 RepID=A0A437SV62_9LACO|nr:MULTISPECIES: S1 RNA-binding domain-containing protein [Lactobacillus]RVU70707.1 S1 RNA-binding domain-containing protein [Lactobacillus xujianguonis]RVU77120.1 S1 RNA-binding domain-containing protein [Lactobacillus xujianguonis]